MPEESHRRPGPRESKAPDAATEGYSATAMDHFERPRHNGVLEDANAVGYMTNPVCGDTLLLMLRVEDEHVEDVRWQSEGCVASIAAASMLSELALGKPLSELHALARERIIEALGGLPASKLHASVLAADALGRALEEYRGKQDAEGGT